MNSLMLVLLTTLTLISNASVFADDPKQDPKKDESHIADQQAKPTPPGPREVDTKGIDTVDKLRTDVLNWFNQVSDDGKVTPAEYSKLEDLYRRYTGSWWDLLSEQARDGRPVKNLWRDKSLIPESMPGKDMFANKTDKDQFGWPYSAFDEVARTKVKCQRPFFNIPANSISSLQQTYASEDFLGHGLAEGQFHYSGTIQGKRIDLLFRLHDFAREGEGHEENNGALFISSDLFVDGIPFKLDPNSLPGFYRRIADSSHRLYEEFENDKKGDRNIAADVFSVDKSGRLERMIYAGGKDRSFEPRAILSSKHFCEISSLGPDDLAAFDQMIKGQK